MPPDLVSQARSLLNEAAQSEAIWRAVPTDLLDRLCALGARLQSQQAHDPTGALGELYGEILAFLVPILGEPEARRRTHP